MSRDLLRTPVSRQHMHASQTPETRIDPYGNAVIKYRQILDDVKRYFNEAVDDIKQRMTCPSALMVTTSSYIINVRESLFMFTNTIVHALNTFIGTVTHSRIEPMWGEHNARVIITGDLHSFVASRITEELVLTLSSTAYISNKVFLYPSVNSSSAQPESIMLSISISDDVRFNGKGHIILLINEDENQSPLMFMVRQRQGWDASAEQYHELWKRVMTILEEVLNKN